jgi:hypothetical protein
MAKLKIAHKQPDGTLVDQQVRPDVNGIVVGGTGGPSQTITSTGVATILVHYKTDAGADVENGYIITQKGIARHLCANADSEGNDKTRVTLTNAVGANVELVLANLSAGEGAINFYPPTGSGSDKLAAKRITNKFVWDFSDNRYLYKLGGDADATYANVESY